jgi:hypothetical protein
MEYPAEYDASDREEVDRFKGWRRQVADSIGDACLFLGGAPPALALLWAEAAAAHPAACASPGGSPGGWRRLEAALAAMLAAVDFRGASGRDPPTSVDAALAPPLLGLLLGLPAALGAAWPG